MTAVGEQTAQDDLASRLENPRVAARRHRWAIAAAGFLLLALASVFAGILAWRTMQASQAIATVAQERQNAHELLEALQAALAAQRGVLLFGSAADRAAFSTADAGLVGAASRLADTAPAQALRTAATGAVARLRIAVELSAAGRQNEALTAAGDDATRQAGAQVLALGRASIDAANGTLANIAARQKWMGGLVVAAIVACLLVAAVLALLLLRDTRRHLHHMAGRELHLHELSATLDQRVAERTRALTEANLRFEFALSATGVTVALQDHDLRFTWISKGDFGQTPEAMLGRTDEEVNPDPSMTGLTAIKRGVIETGEPARREVRIAHDGSERWLDLSVQPVRTDAGAIVGLIAAAIDVTHYKEQETRIRLLMREVTHRSLNLLAVIEAIMRQTARSAATLADFEARFSARLQSLAGSHDLLVQEDWSGASLRALVRSQLGHFADITDTQVEITGPPLHLQPDAAQHIGMALHELAANAARYGALSVPAGRVHIGWRLVAPDPTESPPGQERIELCWQETGGPPVVAPTHRGFGRAVIERTVARGVQGVVKAEYRPDGLRWRLTFPAAATVRT